MQVCSEERDGTRSMLVKWKMSVVELSRKVSVRIQGSTVVCHVVGLQVMSRRKWGWEGGDWLRSVVMSMVWGPKVSG